MRIKNVFRKLYPKSSRLQHPVICLYNSLRKSQKGQKQILRLTTPKLKNVWGPFRSEAVTKFVWRGCLGAVGLMLKVGEAAKIGGVEVR